MDLVDKPGNRILPVLSLHTSIKQNNLGTYFAPFKSASLWNFDDYICMYIAFHTKVENKLNCVLGETDSQFVIESNT